MKRVQPEAPLAYPVWWLMVGLQLWHLRGAEMPKGWLGAEPSCIMSLNVGELHLLDIPSWSCALFLPKSKGSFGAPRTVVGIGWGLYGFQAGLRVWLTAAGPAQEKSDEGPPSKPRSSPVHPACHSGSFWWLKLERACRQYSEGWWVPQACPGPGGSLWQWAWSFSSWANAWGVD